MALPGGFSIYVGSGVDPVEQLTLATFVVPAVESCEWPDGGARVRAVLAPFLPLIAKVDPAVAELLVRDHPRRFAARYVWITTTDLLAVPHGMDEGFLACVRRWQPEWSLPALPSEHGLYALTKSRGWIYHNGAQPADGTTCVADQLLEAPVRLAATALHEGLHAARPTTPAPGIREVRERAASTAELALCALIRRAKTQGALPAASEAEIDHVELNALLALDKLGQTGEPLT